MRPAPEPHNALTQNFAPQGGAGSNWRGPGADASVSSLDQQSDDGEGEGGSGEEDSWDVKFDALLARMQSQRWGMRKILASVNLSLSRACVHAPYTRDASAGDDC